MGYARHVFRRPLCDYPGCGRPLEAAADWYFDMDTMVDAVTGPGGRSIVLLGPDGEKIGMVRADSHVDRNLVLNSDDGEPRFFCPEHLTSRDGKNLGFDPNHKETRPRSDELEVYTTTGRSRCRNRNARRASWRRFGRRRFRGTNRRNER